MKKLAGLNFFTVLLILSVTLVLFSGPAQAYVYDHFTSHGIDTGLWVDRGTNYGLFSQPGDSYLYFNDAIGGQSDRLRSFTPVSGAFFVAIKYSNFQAINTQVGNQGAGSCILLRLGGNNYVDMMEYKNGSGQGFQANSYSGGTTTPLKSVYYGNNSGWLGIRYNGILGSGGKIDFLYNYGMGWKVLTSCAPNFDQAPYFSIVGWNKYGSSLSFQVDQVQIITPNPSPSSILLLEPDF
jgi:hypothetical protein